MFCFAATALLGRYDLHTDDSGVEAFLILLVRFLLGCLHPPRAWQTAALVRVPIPAVELLAGARSGNLKQAWDFISITGFLIALGLAEAILAPPFAGWRRLRSLNTASVVPKE